VGQDVCRDRLNTSCICVSLSYLRNSFAKSEFEITFARNPQR